MSVSVSKLSGYVKFSSDLDQRWEAFQSKRQTRLIQENRFGSAAEKVAEDILQDFFTTVLDWPLSSINNQIGYADIVLTNQGLKRLIVEVKRPGSLSWDKRSLVEALEQARRYAEQQRVTSIAVSDGILFYAVDIKNGGLIDRATLYLDSSTASKTLYWMSLDGIYRPIEKFDDEQQIIGKRITVAISESNNTNIDTKIIHPKYKVPASCFAYVGNPLKTSTWKLPCWLIDGGTDEKRLPGAIRVVLTNYRGAHNKSIPEEAIPDVLVRLGKAAWHAGKMPGQTNKPIESYQVLHDALYQLGRLEEIKER